MPNQEVLIRFKGDPAQLQAALKKVSADYGVAMANVTRSVAQANRTIEQEERKLAATMIRESRAAASVRTQAERQLAADTRRYAREREQIMAQNARAIAAIAKSEADARIREGRRAAASVIAALRETQAIGGSGSGALAAGVVGGLTALVGVSAISELRQGGAALLEYASKLETTKIAFNTMLGSAEKATKHLTDLRLFALRTPFGFPELIDASQRMHALSLETKDVLPLLQSIGDAVAGAGGGSERLDRVVLAISQIQSKGKLATQEMNQLAEAGIPAWKILEEGFGKSRAELVKLVEQGRISAPVFLALFQQFSQANFGGLMEQQSKTFSGALANIKESLLNTSNTAFEPLFNKISEISVRIAEELQKGKPSVEKAIRLMMEGAGEVVAQSAVLLGETIAKSLVSGISNASWWDLLPNNILKRMQPLTYGLIEGIVDAVVERSMPASLPADTQSEILSRMKSFQTWKPKSMRDPFAYKPTLLPGTEKEKKGPDPAATAQRLAELRLRDAINAIQAEEKALTRSLDQRIIDYADYHTKIKALEADLHQRVLAGLDAELKAASQLRKSNQQQIQTEEIRNKIRAENRRHAEADAKIEDNQLAQRRKDSQAAIDILVATIGARVRIQSDADANTLAAVRTLANARVITEEEAEKRILAIRLRANELQQELIKAQSTAAGAIGDPTERRRVQAHLALELAVLEKQKLLIQEQGNRDIDDARKVDLANEREHADELLALKRRVLDQQRDNQRAVIALMILNHARRREVLQAQLQSDIDEENDRHSQEQKSIAAQRQENLESNRTQEEKLERTRELNRLEEEERRRHELEMQLIKEQAKQAQFAASPFGALFGGIETGQFTQLGNEVKAFSDIATVALGAVGTALGGVAQGIGSLIQQWVLYGTVGPNALRKMLAAILAQAAAQAAVEAIMQLAYAWKEAALASASAAVFDFHGAALHSAASAAHLTSAGVFALVGAGAAIAGRVVAGKAFSESTGGSSGSSSGSGTSRSSTASTTPATREVDRRQGFQAQTITNELIFRVKGDVVVDEFVRDYDLNGRTRIKILTDGQG